MDGGGSGLNLWVNQMWEVWGTGASSVAVVLVTAVIVISVAFHASMLFLIVQLLHFPF